MRHRGAGSPPPPSPPVIYEVKYGISLQMTKVIVDPLAAPAAGFSYAMGELLLSYSTTSFHARLPRAHSGSRTFTVTRLAPGAWTVTPSGGAAQPATVGADGVLTFVAAVGAGAFVDAVKN